MTDIGLPLLILIPLIASFVAIIFGNKHAKAIAWISSLTVFSLLAITIFIYSDRVLSFTREWVPFLGINIMLQMDGLSYFFTFLSTFLGSIIVLYSVGYMVGYYKELGRFYFLLLIFFASMLGMVQSTNLIILYIFWEGIGLTCAGLIAQKKESAENLFGASKALLMNFFGSCSMLVGIFIFYGIGGSFDIGILRHVQNLDPYMFALGMFLFILGPIAKSAIVPLTTWLPDAGVAPAPVTALLHAAVMVKAGTYLIARVLGIIQIDALPWHFLLSLLGVVTILSGVTMALMQSNIKRLLACHTISQIGYVVLGIGLGTPLGLVGGLFHAINHGLFKGLLFLSAGAVEKETHTKDMEKMGGLSKKMPVTFILCVIASLSISGVPLFNGFNSKWLIYNAVAQTAIEHPIFIVLLIGAMLGSILTLASFVKVLHGVFLGQLRPHLEHVKDPVPTMLIPLVVMGIGCIVFGVIPHLPLNLLIIPAAVGQAPFAFPDALMIGDIGFWNPILAALVLIIVVGLSYIAIQTVKVPSIDDESDKGMTFYGGEIAPTTHVTAHNLYYDMKANQPMKFISSAGKAGGYDLVHYSFARGVKLFANIFRKTHDGILTTSIAWVIIGFTAILLTMLAL
ncbi:MAG: NADH-quinone oxidoreductase subunit L [Methanobacterium sp.]|jgi:NADH:ubiquinone oxidoreductase subunit 5 (subunit L)/multisubunit Na+/H+ antiporter MnhA subunit